MFLYFVGPVQLSSNKIPIKNLKKKKKKKGSNKILREEK